MALMLEKNLRSPKEEGQAFTWVYYSELAATVLVRFHVVVSVLHVTYGSMDLPHNGVRMVPHEVVCVLFVDTIQTIFYS